MKAAAHLWIEDEAREDGERLRAAVLETAGVRHRLSYRFPFEDGPALSDRHDAFVVGLVFRAMLAGSDVRVHGRVSASLLANLEEFQRIWCAWRPQRYHPIAWGADEELDDGGADPARPALSAFSGGVDACFTAFRHRRGLAGRTGQPLAAGLMVHGFDIPLHDRAAFDTAFSNSQALLGSLGMDLYAVRTDYRALGDDWTDAFAAGAASCLMWFDRAYGAGLIGSSEPYGDLYFPWGSNPLSDPLLGSGRFRIVHDGAAYSRTEKVRVLAGWPEALARLRVCWAGADKSRNCGRCEKCIRTTLNFRAVGVKRLACMPEDVSDERILKVRGLSPVLIKEFEQILAAADEGGIADSWVEALRRTLRRNRLGIRWGGGARQRLRSKLIEWWV
jgi:hypothetical protein